MTIVREFREAWRRLWRRPGYSLLSIAVLGVGLGVLVFVFGMINAVVLQPYPFPQASRLMSVGEPWPTSIGNIDSAEYLALKRNFGSADAMGAAAYTSVNLDNGAGAARYQGGTVTASLLDMLGATPLLGRTFTPADDKPGAPRVVVLSAALWRHAFQSDPHIIGRSVRVNGAYATVVGVMRPGFQFPPAVHLWLPMHLAVGQHQDIRAVVRLAPGVTLGQARAELDARNAQLQRLLPPDTKVKPLIIGPLRNTFTPSDLRHWVWLMFGAGVLVMLLACINVANLQLVQTLKREHELALRSALGSSRTRIIAGTLIESLVLCVVALAPAFAIALGGTHWLDATWISIHPATIPYQHGIDGWVVLFGVLVALVGTALAGGIPAWRASRASLASALREDSKSSGGGFARVAKGLVMAEVALTVVLLVGAGMMVGALHHLLAQSQAGTTHAAHVLTADVSLPTTLYKQDVKRVQFFNTVVQRLQNAPGVVAATAANAVPGGPRGVGNNPTVALPGHAEPAQGWQHVGATIVGKQALATYGIRLVKGRFFEARDKGGSHPVVVVDTRLAATFWPHGGALNRQLVLNPGRPSARTLTVIGVVEALGLDTAQNTPMPGLLLPVAQAAGLAPLQWVGLAVRVHGNPNAFAASLTQAVHATDSQVAIFNVSSQAAVIDAGNAGVAILADVFGALGLVALLLAAAGLYGVLAFSVAQRTREIGIRRAIGADSAAIMRTVGRQLAWQLGIGLIVGIVLAIPWSSMLANPEVGTQAHDPMVFVPVLLVVIGVSLVAALVPVVRALRVDPAEALRYE